jgi:hypothetical protein
LLFDVLKTSLFFPSHIHFSGWSPCHAPQNGMQSYHTHFHNWLSISLSQSWGLIMFTFRFCVFISVTYALAVTIFTSVLSALAASLSHSFVWRSNWYITYHWIKKLIWKTCGLSYSTTARWNLWTRSFLRCSENSILSNVAHNSSCSPPFQIGIYTVRIWLWPTVCAQRLNNCDVLSRMSPCKSLSLIAKGTCWWGPANRECVKPIIQALGSRSSLRKSLRKFLRIRKNASGPY